MPLKGRDMIDMSDPRVAQIGHPAPPWLVNYADLMTELVCFFVILYALSAALNKDVQKAKKDVEETMKEEKIQGEVKVSKEGMQITLEEKGENVFFESGSSELSPRMEEIMAKLAPILQTLVKAHHEVVVEGHTDDVPISNPRFPSNWELSTARATSVVQYMIHALKFPPPSLAAIGYGQFHPLVANDTPEHRSMNRRVVFFVKNPPPTFKPGTEKKKDEVAPAPGTASPDTAAVAPAATGPPAEAGSAEPTASGTSQDVSNPIPQEPTSRPADVQPGEVVVSP